MSRLPPYQELVNVFEFEEAAKSVLPRAVYSTIEGSKCPGFNRITFRPRMMVPTLDLDLSVELFGKQHCTPIFVGPVAEQGRYHPDAELATIKGASNAQAAMFVSDSPTIPIREIAAAGTIPLCYTTYAEQAQLDKIQQAVETGFHAVCVTLRLPEPDWTVIGQLAKTIEIPVLVKGVMSCRHAALAIDHGAKGIIVSDHASHRHTTVTPIEALDPILNAVAGKAAVLIDGSFRRGTHILIALALGAKGVLLSRPIMWALAAYGAKGVQSLIQMLQRDLARNMAMLGATNLKALDRSMIKIHSR